MTCTITHFRWPFAFSGGFAVIYVYFEGNCIPMEYHNPEIAFHFHVNVISEEDIVGGK